MDIYSDFRNREDVLRLASLINKEISDRLNIMEICGGHTHSIMKFGLNSILKNKINFLHGPGCPVCIMPVDRIDEAIAISRIPDVILATFGDMMRVPGSKSSLLKERANGKDVRMVYSPLDILKIAENKNLRNKKIVFFAIGFETTTPMTAALLSEVVNRGLTNVFFHINHVLVPPAMEAVLKSGNNIIDGFVCPGHVSVITGSSIYADLPGKYGKPAVISGFEPLDIMTSVLMIARQVKNKNPRIENSYKRAVMDDGNKKARSMVEKFFDTRNYFEWRGFGKIPASGLKLKDEFSRYDAEKIFEKDLKKSGIKDSRINSAGRKNKKNLCKCGEILRGISKPTDCVLFSKSCTPETPLGACMVSNEGACAAYYKYDNIDI